MAKCLKAFPGAVMVIVLLAGCTPQGGGGVSAVGGGTPSASLSSPPNSAPPAGGAAFRGSTSAPSAGHVVAVRNSLSTPAPNAGYVPQAEYQVSPMDTLEVSVYQVEDLRRTVQVDQSGRINLPLIGDVPAAGSTVQQLEKRIAGLLGATYLQSPQVTVTVRDAPGRKITVDGAVKRPGIFSVSGKTTLQEAIALSGGLDDVAKESDVTVFRTIRNERQAAVFNLGAIRKGQLQNPEIFAGDVIVVGRSGFKTTVRDIGPALGIFTRAVTLVP